MLSDITMKCHCIFKNPADWNINNEPISPCKWNKMYKRELYLRSVYPARYSCAHLKLVSEHKEETLGCIISPSDLNLPTCPQWHFVCESVGVWMGSRARGDKTGSCPPAWASTAWYLPKRWIHCVSWVEQETLPWARALKWEQPAWLLTLFCFLLTCPASSAATAEGKCCSQNTQVSLWYCGVKWM